MRNAYLIKITLLSALAVSAIGFVGGCGNEKAPDAGASVKEDLSKVNDRTKLIEDQYKTKK